MRMICSPLPTRGYNFGYSQTGLLIIDTCQQALRSGGPGAQASLEMMAIVHALTAW
jgi:hypothetical protein